MTETNSDKEKDFWEGYFACKAKEISNPIAFIKGNPWLIPKKHESKIIEIV